MAQFRTAIVTGGASGIGLATALHLLALPSTPAWRVLVLDLSAGPSALLAPHLEAFPDRLKYLSANVTSHAALQAGFQLAKQWEGGEGRVDLVAAIAGISQKLSDPDGQDPFLSGAKLGQDGLVQEPNLRLVDINLGGVLKTTQLAIAYMREQAPDAQGKKGRILVAGSTASIYAFPNESLYGTAKHGVLGLTRSLSATLKPLGITINAIAPSLIATGIAGDPNAFDPLKALNAVTPMETVMRAVGIIAGEGEPAGEWISGQILECTLNTVSFRRQAQIQNEDEARCLNVMWPREEVNDSLRLPEEIPRVRAVPWDEGEVKVGGGVAVGRWEGVNVVVD